MPRSISTRTPWKPSSTTSRGTAEKHARAPLKGDSIPQSIDIADLEQQLVSHRLFPRIESPETLRVFLASHVFAVWDFLSLVKALQIRFTCVEVPWTPKGDPRLRRLINEIVLDEESDLGPSDEPTSHFELYLAAMTQAGVSTRAIDRFTEALGQGQGVKDALETAGAPAPVARFVLGTLAFTTASDHELAAAFAYGREEIIPPTFRLVVGQAAVFDRTQWNSFRYYLERHIGRDSESHGPLARELVAHLCGDEPKRWAEAEQAARESLAARIRLFDFIADEIDRA